MEEGSAAADPTAEVLEQDEQDEPDDLDDSLSPPEPREGDGSFGLDDEDNTPAEPVDRFAN